MSTEDKEEKKYLGISQELDEIRYGHGNKAVSGLKILGKGLWNMGVFAVTEAIPKAVEINQKHIDKNKK